MAGGCPWVSIDRFDSFDSSFGSIDVRYYCVCVCVCVAALLRQTDILQRALRPGPLGRREGVEEYPGKTGEVPLAH